MKLKIEYLYYIIAALAAWYIYKNYIKTKPAAINPATPGTGTTASSKTNTVNVYRQRATARPSAAPSGPAATA